MTRGKSFTSLLNASTIAFGLVFAAAAPAMAKKIVCSATLNSDNEIKTFKQVMGTQDFEYVELTALARDENVTRHDWFESACEKKIQCDILIVSGHFGGTFFGSSGLILPMETLEKGSCDRKCDGILQRPKEVFLFGCNTLAGKERDRRSPEEYRRVLMQDGFSAEEAERIVSFRYSPFGDSFADRMRQVFPRTPRIYGNDSVGPVGKDIEGSWRRYLQSAKANRYYDRLDSLDGSINRDLMGWLKWTAMQQVSGDPQSLVEEQPICKLSNLRMSTNAKLLWIERTFASGKYLRSLPHIVEFFQELDDKKTYLSGSDQRVLDRISRLTKVRDEIAPLLQKPDDALLGMQLKIYALMTRLKWMTAAEKAQGVSRIVLGDVNRAFNQGRLDRILSFRNLTAGIVVDFSSAAIPDARWKEIHFLKALASLTYKSAAIEERLLPMATTTSGSTDLRLAAAAALGGLRGARSETIQTLVREMESNSSAGVRRAAAVALRTAGSDRAAVGRLIRALSRETDVEVLSSILSALPGDKTALAAQIAYLQRMPAPRLRAQLVNRLVSLSRVDKAAVQLALGEALLREPGLNLQSAILEGLSRLGAAADGAWKTVKSVDQFWSRTKNHELKIMAAMVSEKLKGSSNYGD